MHGHADHIRDFFRGFLHSSLDPVKHDTYETVFVKIRNKFLLFLCNPQILALLFHHSFDQLIGQAVSVRDIEAAGRAVDAVLCVSARERYTFKINGLFSKTASKIC